MRISDWSSDVCSSDLIDHWWSVLFRPSASIHGSRRALRSRNVRDDDDGLRSYDGGDAPRRQGQNDGRCQRYRSRGGCGIEFESDAGIPRSEEHTSELQSLIRMSDAVYCLKKKTHRT